MKMKHLVCSCAAMLGLSGAVQAHEDLNNESKFSVLFGGGKYFTDSERNLDDGSVGEIGIGYIIDKHWAVEAIYSDMSGIDSDTTGSSVDADMYRLDALYHFGQGHWRPYMAAGVGELTFDPEGGSSDDEVAYNLGGGIKYLLARNFSVRGDVRAVYGNDSNDLDTLATVGFNYVFGAQAAEVMDSDGDGVEDGADRCPGTPAGVAVDMHGCALDSDNDGVADYMDKCPNTEAGLKVDKDGCPVLETEHVKIELDILFDTDKSIVKPEFMPEIQKVAAFMKKYPSTHGVIEGHTDSIGDAKYNKGLSLRRADAVRDLLVKKYGVDAERLTAEGFGEERPRATNSTAEGRHQNRRVVAVIKNEVKKAVHK